ncbi:MAG: hypothetical protein IJL90_00060 [Lachnospiraceae bacterium]|nr:hypothetical protein [Lachnospiraceae bacterium]
MKIILALALTLGALVAWHIPIFKKRRGVVLTMYALGMIAFFAVYNIRTMDHIIRFCHPTNQIVYQPEFLATGEYPDAFLDEFLKGKTVYTPNDAFDTARADELSDELGDYWLYYWYHAVNMWNYLLFDHATVIKDDSLNGYILSEEKKSYYEDLGPANDLMRYTFVLTDIEDEVGNGFYFYWFYNSFIGDTRVYVCPEGMEDAGELVVLWQHIDDHDTDSYYIAAKPFFDEVIAK